MDRSEARQRAGSDLFDDLDDLQDDLQDMVRAGGVRRPRWDPEVESALPLGERLDYRLRLNRYLLDRLAAA